MTETRKQKLIDLGADALADALLDLAVHSEEADDLIEQLLATPKENIQRFKEKLSGLKHSGRFVDWRGAAGFAWELEMLLQDVKAGVDVRLQELSWLRPFMRRTVPFLRCVMTPPEISAISSAMMPKNCLWTMPHVVLKKKKLQTSF